MRRTSHLLSAAALCLSLVPAAGAEEEKFGEVNFPISCSPAAQTQFNRAVAMLHSFFFPETIKAFTAIAQQEPSCAMAYWGIAIGQRPNPLVAPFPADLMSKGWQAIEAGRAAGAKTQREQDWIDAHAGLRGGDGKVGRTPSRRQRGCRVLRARSQRSGRSQRQDLCQTIQGRGDPAGGRGKAAKSPGRTALHHTQLRFRADLPRGPARGAALRRTGPGGAACAPHALAYVFPAGDVA